MKSFYLKDGLQIVVAILLTGTMVYAMEPPKSTVSENQPIVATETQKQDNIAPEEKKASEPIKKKPEAPKETKDPNHCEPKRYWAKDPPYECIDKPTQAKSVSNVGTSSSPVSVSGNKESWLRAAGIPENDWANVDYIVSRESGWNPCAYNPGQSNCGANPSSACGLVQQYPCGKIPGHWTDPVAALKWQKAYVCGEKFNAYAGSTCYARAVSYWQSHGNY